MASEAILSPFPSSYLPFRPLLLHHHQRESISVPPILNSQDICGVYKHANVRCAAAQYPKWTCIFALASGPRTLLAAGGWLQPDDSLRPPQLS